MANTNSSQITFCEQPPFGITQHIQSLIVLSLRIFQACIRFARVVSHALGA